MWLQTRFLYHFIITQLHILVKGRALRRLAVCATIKPAAPGFCGAFWTPKSKIISCK
jgi:hypothetical protein